MTITDVQGLFYQNDMESQYAKEKRMQCFKTDDVMQAVRTIETMIQRQEDEERASLYGNLHHMAPAYKRTHKPGISGTFLSLINIPARSDPGQIRWGIKLLLGKWGRKQLLFALNMEKCNFFGLSFPNFTDFFSIFADFFPI